MLFSLEYDNDWIIDGFIEIDDADDNDHDHNDDYY